MRAMYHLLTILGMLLSLLFQFSLLAQRKYLCTLDASGRHGYFMGYRKFRSALLHQHKEALARKHPFFILRFRNCKITLFRMIRKNREKRRSLL
jgi:hypothetical protein